jgi:peptidoglycan/xylan/chitin deacetylase (PgdA/CDA1 family)
VLSANRFLTAAAVEFAHFSGLARIWERSAGGVGAILRFERVRPKRAGRFQPLRSREITPEFLERVILALKRWKFDVVSMDEVCRRAQLPATGRRFVALSFDGGYRDFMTHGYPVLARHGVPFAVYIATAFPDGLGEAWWLALQEAIAKHDRIGLVMKERERHFNIAGVADKYELYDFLANWMRSLPPADRTAAVNDLCKRYSVDLAALSREASMTWEDVTTLAADPRTTIGSTTVNLPALAAIPDDAARREMTMGKAVAQAAVGRELQHFAYPFGHSASFDTRHVLMAAEAGFASAVSSRPGVIQPDGRTSLHALPRLNWDGRLGSVRALRVLLSGLRFGE